MKITLDLDIEQQCALSVTLGMRARDAEEKARATAQRNLTPWLIDRLRVRADRALVLHNMVLAALGLPTQNADEILDY